METLMEQPFSMIGSPVEIFENNIIVLRNIKQELDDINDNARNIA